MDYAQYKVWDGMMHGDEQNDDWTPEEKENVIALERGEIDFDEFVAAEMDIIGIKV